MKSKIVVALMAIISFVGIAARASDEDLLNCLREKDQIIKKINQPMYVCAVEYCTLAVGYGKTRDEALQNAYQKFTVNSPSGSRDEQPVCELVAQ